MDLASGSPYKPRIESFQYCRGLQCEGASTSCQLATNVEGVFGTGMPGAPTYVSVRAIVNPAAQLQFDYIVQPIVDELLAKAQAECASVLQRNTNIRIALGQIADPFTARAHGAKVGNDGYAWEVCTVGRRPGRGPTNCEIRDSVFRLNFIASLRHEQNLNVQQARRDAEAERKRIAAEAEARKKAQKSEEFFRAFGQSVSIVFSRNIHVNPFVYVNSRPILMRGRFVQMLSADTGLFELNGGPVVLDRLDPKRFQSKASLLVQLTVRGNKMVVLPNGQQVLAIDGRFVNSLPCESSGCGEYF